MSSVKFTNTNIPSDRISFREAFLRGMGPGFGLYTIHPREIPILDYDEIAKMSNKTYSQIAHKVLLPYVKDDIDSKTLESLLETAYPNSMSPKIERVVLGDESDVTRPPSEGRYVMWLTSGPTYSFKDYAARFFGTVLNHFLEEEGKRKTVIVATSGDTGGAVADALHGLPNVDMITFYPNGNSVSPGQRRQMTTLGKNIYAIEVNGTFDVCQELAKALLDDKEFAFQTFGDGNHFTSANSISIGRMLPQVVYPFYAYSRIEHGSAPLAFSIPSGNFGDMMGTLIAKSMGLPLDKIVCAVNDNRAFEVYMATHEYIVNETAKSPSTAMNVAHPSNLARLIFHYGGHMFDLRDESGRVIKQGEIDKEPNFERMANDIFVHSVGDRQHFRTIKNVWDDTRYMRRKHRKSVMLDPHGAVAWRALDVFEHTELPYQSVIFETADPGKFPELLKQELGLSPTIPAGMAAQKGKPEYITRIVSQPDFSANGNQTLSQNQLAEAKFHIRSLLG